jgi:ATP-dependent DNA helicase DinG
LKKVLLDYFPGNPRPVQKEILDRVESALKSGYKKIIIQSPTGTGKSFLAATIARWQGSSSILTATTELQDQYSKDFAYMRTVRGKTHFPCLQLILLTHVVKVCVTTQRQKKIVPTSHTNHWYYLKEKEP